MSLLTDIKNKLFQRRKAAETAPSPAIRSGDAPLNLKTAKEIILLFPADSADDRKIIDKWRDDNKSATRHIRLYGYFQQDIGEANFGCEAIKSKDLNWFGAPAGDIVERFRQEPCDLLIRLGDITHRELDYLAAIKGVKLKVGPFNPDADSPYHLQFDARRADALRNQLVAIEQIFSYTNATATS
jgi:hypothetical protein